MRKRITVGLTLALALFMFISAGAAAWQGAVSITGADANPLDATKEVLENVSRIRGLEIKNPVKSGLKTQDEIEQSVIRDLDETTTPEEFEATQKTLIKMGLIGAEFKLREYVVKLLREQVAGFYQPKTKEFYLAAWLPISEQKTVIAHELVHALQDQHFNLRRFEDWPKGDSDAELAAQALVEGDATIVMFQYSAEQQKFAFDVTKIPPLTERLLEQDEGSDSSKYPVLANAPSVLKENLQFPYVYGVGFAQAVLKKQSWASLNKIYFELPKSTEQIMHPERFFAGDKPVKIDMGDLISAMGRDWKRVDEDVNGEFGYRVLLAEFISKNKSRAAAEGWGGDRYALFEDKKTGALLLAQFTTWDTPRDAKEFFDAYAERTQKRYRVAGPATTDAQSRIYETAEGLAWIEVRDRDVAIIEGALDRGQLTRLGKQIRQSRKKTGSK